MKKDAMSDAQRRDIVILDVTSSHKDVTHSVILSTSSFLPNHDCRVPLVIEEQFS